MLKMVRDLFSVGGGADGSQDRAEDGLRRLWVSLIRVGAARGLNLPDAEDLAQESIVAAMEGFDPGRGEFGSYCRTIMANRTASFHRAARPQVPIPTDGGGFVDPGGSPEWELYHRQCRERSDRVVADAISTLDDEEADFFLVLAEVHEDLSHGEVSEAARRSGIAPRRGWDVFRRIQRRFKQLEQELPLPVSPPATRLCSMARTPRPASGTPPPPSDIEYVHGRFLDHLRERYSHFTSGLEAGARSQLRALLR